MAHHQYDANVWGLTDPRPTQSKPKTVKLKEDDNEFDWADPPEDGVVVTKTPGAPDMESDSSDDECGVPSSSYKQKYVPVREIPKFPEYKPVVKESQTGLSRKKQRNNEFLEKQKVARKNWKKANRVRPQTIYKHFLRRARQINSGLVKFSYHPFAKIVQDWNPDDSVLSSNGNWTIYKQTGGIPNPKWIGTKEELDEMTRKLMTCERVAFDLEGHNDDTKSGFVALLQFSTEEFGDFQVDAIGLQEDIKSIMKPLFESLVPLKIMFDLTNDIPNMQKAFDIFVIGVIDLQELYSINNKCGQISLTNLCKAYYPKDKNLLNEEQTLSDWTARPLTTEQVIYACNDSHFILKIYDMMVFHLCKEGALGKEILVKGFEGSKQKTLVVWDNPACRRSDFKLMAVSVLNELIKKNKNWFTDHDSLSDSQMENFEHLVEWRLRLSNALDRKEQNVLSAARLFEISTIQTPTYAIIKKVMGEQGLQLCRETNQIPVILNMLNEGDVYMQKWRNFRCHNCVKIGHGATWACPFPENKNRVKEYFKLPENRDKYHRIQRQRRLNTARNKKARQGEQQQNKF